MAREQAEDLTGAYSPQILRAIKTIGQGLVDLADALIAQGDSVKPEPRPAAARSPNKEAQPPAEEDQDEEPGIDDQPEEAEEIKLADLQKMAKNLIKAGGRDKLLKILEDLGLENVSSAPETVWPQLKQELEAASAE